MYAAIAQLGERKTEDLKVTGSIPVRGIKLVLLVAGFANFMKIRLHMR